MSVETRLESVAGTLAVYQEQMAALSQALQALKVVAEVIASGLSASQGECLVLAREISAGAAASLSLAAIDGAELNSAAPAEPAESDDIVARSMDDVHLEAFELGLDFAETSAESLSLQGEQGELVGPAAAAEPQPGDIAAETQIEAIAADAETNAEIAVATQAETEGAIVAPVEAAAEEASTSETTFAAPSAEVQHIIDQIAAAANADDGKVVDLAARRALDRATTPRPSRRRALGITAALFAAACGTVGFQELLQTDIARQFIELGSCDGEAVAASRDCAVLAWLHL